MWLCKTCTNRKDVSNNSCPKPQAKNYTLVDVMTKLEKMDEKYISFLTQYKEQIKVNEKFQAKLSKIKHQLNKNKQNKLKNNLLMQGVAYKANENITDIINK